MSLSYGCSLTRKDCLRAQKADGLTCDKHKPLRKRSRRSLMDEVADSLGLTKVRGAVSGRTYYE